ncbi:MAG: hypothetical protein ACE5OS_13935, partial [Anaerolineae bacterium]
PHRPEEPVLDRVFQRRLFTAGRPTQPCSRRRRSAPAKAPAYPHRPEEPVLDRVFQPRLFTAGRPTQRRLFTAASEHSVPAYSGCSLRYGLHSVPAYSGCSVTTP